MSPVVVEQGTGPVVLGLPHTGTWLPEAIRARLNTRGQLLADTDWHIERLYAGLLPGATTVRATFHRYVIDANRGPDDASLYPGQNTTGLVPVTDFDGLPIWTETPDATEIADRTARFHAPYHAALAAEIERVRARHGVAILYDCHSIRSHIPFLFEGTLPDFNIGTNDVHTFSPSGQLVSTEQAVDPGNDGLVVLPDGTKYVSSVRQGTVSRIRPGQKAEIVASGIPSAASMTYDSKRNRLVIPMNDWNAIAIVDLNK